MPFIYFLFLNCRFSSKNAFHVHVTAQFSSGNVIVILYSFQTLIVDIKDCLGHPWRYQLCVACEKWDLSFWTTSNFILINDTRRF